MQNDYKEKKNNYKEKKVLLFTLSFTMSCSNKEKGGHDALKLTRADAINRKLIGNQWFNH